MKVEVNAKGEVWYYPTDPTKEPQLLADCDSLCGSGIFETGPGDPFRDCCSWHDRAYSERAFFEAHGWNREDIDLYLLELMLKVAGEDFVLIARAYTYHVIVRCVGWYFYNKHPTNPKVSRDNININREFMNNLLGLQPCT